MNQQTKHGSIRILRNAIQVAAFLLIPGLFIASLNGIKSLVDGIVTQNMNGVLAACFPTILLVVMTALFGRFFCGFLCSFGTLGDVMHFIGSKVFRIRLQMPKTADRMLKSLKYVLLAALIGIWAFGKELPEVANPWNAFGSLLSLPPDVSYVFSNMLLGAILLILIMVASLFIDRFFCRYLCPMGAVFAVVSHLRFLKLFKPREKCGSCSYCTHTCKMGIAMGETDCVSSGECIGCLQCVGDCPKGNLRPQIGKVDVAVWILSVLAVVTMGLYMFGNPSVLKWSASQSAGITSEDATGNASDSQNSAATESEYQDGTFEGSGTGFRGGTTTVSVTIENGKITEIQTVSTQDDAEWYNEAFSSIQQSVIESQDADVDAVTGATYSSNGIREAIANALAAAKGEEVDSSSDSGDTSGEDSGSTSDNEYSQPSYDSQDGGGHGGHGGGQGHRRNQSYYQ